MKLLSGLLLAGHPQETRFFAFVGGFGLVLAAIYWFASYETAGTVLLVGFGLAGVFAAVRLIAARPRRVATGARRRDPLAESTGDEARDEAGSGTGGVDVPFLDEAGRLPGDTLAPLALGLGIALALTAIVFGPWLVVAGIVPLGWGAWQWLAGARDELEATVLADPAEPRRE